MTIPTLTTLPVAPARTDPPATFVTRADAFLAAIVTFQGEMNISIGAMNTDIAGVNADAVAAAAAAAAAVPAAASATASAATAAADAVIAGDAAGEIQALYLGSKSANPTTDNQGNPLVVGAMYFNTVINLMRVYLGNSTWADAGSAVNGTLNRQNYVATSGQTVFAINYDVGFVDVYLNGVKLVVTTDFTALTGTEVTLVTGATVGDEVELIAYGAFSVADQLQISNNLSDVASAPASIINLGINATAAELNYVSGVTSNIQTQIDSVIPDQTGNSGKYLSTDGTDPSWETLSVVGGGGTTTALPATLTSASVAAHTLTSTSFGKALTLPDATTLSKGVTVFAFKNDSSYDVPIKNDAGQIINWLYGGDYTVCTLTDNSTANGKWDFSNKQVIGLLGSGEFILPTATSVYDYNQCKLSDDKWVVVVSQSGDYLAVVYDKSTQTFGSLTLVNTTAATSGIAVQRVSDTQFIIAAASSTTVNLFTATVSGTTITPENSASATLPSAMTNAKAFEFVPYNGSFIFASYSSTEMFFFAASVSGTTPSAGSVESYPTTGTGIPPIIPDSQTSDRFLTYFYNQTGTTTSFLTYTVSGTTLTAVAGPVSTASTAALTYIFPQLDDGRFIVRLRNSTQAKYVVATLTGSNITLSTASITPNIIESYIFGWKLIGNDVICVTTDSGNKIAIESARNTNGVATAATEFVNSNYGGWLAGQSDNGLYILNQDFQEYDTQVYKITVDGSGNPQREFVDYYKATQSFTPKIAWFGQYEQSGFYISPYMFGLESRNSTISPVNYKAMASNRYHQIGDDIELQTAAYWDTEKSTIIQFSGKRAGNRSYVNVTQNHFDGDFSEGWDSWAYQLIDSPNTYALWINLRKVCDA